MEGLREDDHNVFDRIEIINRKYHNTGGKRRKNTREFENFTSFLMEEKAFSVWQSLDYEIMSRIVKKRGAKSTDWLKCRLKR